MRTLCERQGVVSMGKSNRRKFADKMRRLAEKQGIRIGFLIITDGDGTSGYSSYTSIEDANEGLIAVRDLLADLERRETE